MSAREPTDGDDSPTNLVARDESSGERGAQLVAMWGGGGALQLDLADSATLVIGRAEGVDVRIQHDSVSRRHAVLRVTGGTATIEDLGSANGTRIAGKRSPPNAAIPIAYGAPVEVGTAIMVLLPASADPVAPAASSSSPARAARMQRLDALVDVVARSRLSVLLIGETGVGKERLAAQVHDASPRAKGPFVKVNCAALVETLLEAELFGHERGAFTGATHAKPGLVEAAHGGTLFLDELGDMPASTQARLLRVLESGEVTRVGSVVPRKVDVRIVAATNVDLRALVEAGRFRRDLYFRLDGATVVVPPLRERAADIPALAQSFADEAADEAGRPRLSIAQDAIDRLAQHDWPGNVRELRNVVARSVLFCASDVLSARDLRFESVSDGAMPMQRAPSPDDDERRRIQDALDRSVQNQTRAAKLLGISRRTLLNRLDALGMPRPRKRDD